MGDIIEEPVLLLPRTRCTRCNAPEGTEPEKSRIENWRCPHCATKFCAGCFKFNFDDPMGHTFFCPNPSCKKLLKFS